MLNCKTATGSLFESPDEKERNQDGDIRAGGGECVVGQRPLWAILLQNRIYAKYIFFYFLVHILFSYFVNMYSLSILIFF
jgi:hypothetical protein